MDADRLDDLDHVRLRAACAEEALAQRSAADATAAREQIQRAISQKYCLGQRDSVDVPTGVITRAAVLRAVPAQAPAEEPAS